MQEQRSRFWLWLAIWFAIVNGSADSHARNEISRLKVEVETLRLEVESLREARLNTMLSRPGPEGDQ